ncbi:hypothetical protein M1L60_16510 [Actinoplanes sp. TRM 88003]|uniref:Uncharacterized protein n=1 Tax=Paractinoplanes aksuensis TaxID=2939490 RepID=A0ABT1DMY4_9ACTN|nr:hypothetical protein [Actinoplanes aksuensis]MCO8272198.1 hypothetical protein [Actinoplanes aksuensis]
MLIPKGFNGPPSTGNGGWSAGAFAVAAGAEVGGPALEVTLRVPPPLETELTFADGAVHDGETLVATVAETSEPVSYAASVPLPEAVRAAEAYAGFTRHPFPTCYVCGTDRPDGLRIFPGPLPDGRTAAPWTVPAEVDLPVVWAALDCPGGWTALQNGRTYVLGRIAATTTALPEPGSTCVIMGEATGFSGRKAMVLSTIYGPDGSPLSTARATWIATT